jgi:putative DNA primase/helicase
MIKMEIPKQLHNFNFVLVGGDDGKKPIEKGWQKKIHRIDYPVLQKHLENGKNYGVQSNNSFVVINEESYFLIVIDFDTKEFQDKVINNFPETFTTTSGSDKKCWHIWLASDNNKPFKIHDENMKTLADIIGAGNQVIAPGSKHLKSGKTYSIVKDIPIVFMPYAEIEAILKPYDKKPKQKEKEIKQYVPKGIENSITEKILSSISMKEVLEEVGIDTSKNPTNCFKHESAGGKCLGWNNETAHCFHCDGRWNKFSLIRDAKNLTDKSTFEWFAEKSGMIDELKKSRKEYVKKNEKPLEVSIGDSSLKSRYLDLVKDKKWNNASELLVNWILENNSMYTTKDDIKSEVWIYKNGIYIPQGKSEVKEILRKLLGNWYSTFTFNNVMAKLEPDTFIDSNKFFNQNYIDEVPVQNGILNVLTKELKPFDKKQVFFNKLPITYNPNATCLTIEKHLKDTLKFEEDINVMYEVIGFLLYKDYFLEKMIMLIGDGRNGKGKTIDLIRRFLGMDNCASIPLSALNTDNFRVSELFGRMANLAGDLSNTSLKDTGMLKQTTGRDLIGANRKFLNDIKFVNYAKHIFACNELPKVYDMSKGFWSRWIVLEFPYEFISEREYNSMEENKRTMKKILDPYHIDKISSDEELSGLLNKALEGLQRIRKNKTFSYSKGTDEIKKFWIRKSDSFVAFCFDNLEESNEKEMTKAELRKAYYKYCSEHKLKGCSDKAMSITLQEMFGVIENRKWVNDKQKQENIWEGIQFKQSSKYSKNYGKL